MKCAQGMAEVVQRLGVLRGHSPTPHIGRCQADDRSGTSVACLTRPENLAGLFPYVSTLSV